VIGIEERDTDTGIHVVRLHYTADPEKRSDEWKQAAAAGMSSRAWAKEYEIDWTVASGLPVYGDVFVREIHVAKEPLLAYPERAIYRGWDYGLCYSSDTEVLTKSGWRFVKDVKRGELVATRNPETGDLEYTKVLFKVGYPYKGKMLQWDSQNLQCCVTPEHIVPFTFRDSPGKVKWQTAQWLADHMTGHHYVDLTAHWRGEVALWVSPMEMDALIYAEFMGLYLSEGSAYTSRLTGGKVSIYQAQYRQDWQDVLDRTGLSWVYREGIGWTTHSSKCAKWLKRLGVAKTKRVPDNIKSMPPSFIRAFIQRYSEGDGHIRTRKNGSVEHTVYTISKHMADDMQELALKAGWCSSIRWVPPQSSVIDEPKGKRTINGGGGYNITFKKCATRAELLKANFSEIDYDGTVHCLSVPYHTLYVRRNGKPHWNGNTPACVWVQVDPMGRLNVLEEMVTWNGRGPVVQQGIERMTPAVVLKSNEDWPETRDWRDVADPAGWQKAQTDEKSCVQVQNSLGVHPAPGPVSWVIRKRGMVDTLQRMSGGRAQIVVSPVCRMLIEGFGGAYRYQEVGETGRYTEDVEKNAWSHPMNALEYVVSKLFLPPEPERRGVRKRRVGDVVTGY